MCQKIILILVSCQKYYISIQIHIPNGEVKFQDIEQNIKHVNCQRSFQIPYTGVDSQNCAPISVVNGKW